ncbi:T-complex protein 1 alpha subunit [Striga asiatica]|uniref:T-complex protein 1 subunit alpha n=1 Tax=Striga asiatica TaxID=4170 RepID=A0A5A7PF87_STRAF|nr:T-complex protein 1 alpha subunit [Striga asiatica]
MFLHSSNSATELYRERTSHRVKQIRSRIVLSVMAISSQPDISGERQSGQDVRTQNVVACQAVANIVKSSLGPVGLDKMLVDDIGDVTITNDGATILKMLEVEHPAAKVLVELAELQDREVGDGTTSVVIIAAELLKRANDLVRNKIHPTSIISGYRLAMREACKYVDEKLAVKVEKLGKDSLVNSAKTSMSSKLIGGNSDFFANLVVEAVQAVKMTNARGEVRYPIKGINILKAHGQSARDSYLLKGYALNTGRAAQGMPLRVAPARIACLDFNLQKTKMQMGVQVLVNDPRELEKIRQPYEFLDLFETMTFSIVIALLFSVIAQDSCGIVLKEADMTKERIEKLLKAGANVVLTTKGIDDMALKACFLLIHSRKPMFLGESYFVEAGAIAVRRVRKEDLRHVAKATGATAISTFADMEGEETFDSSLLGYAEEVVEERIADDDVILIKGTKTSSAVSLILRGANDYMLDEMDRALHDALCIVKRTLESNTVVAGGGAVEAALSVYLENLATTLGSREQLAIAEFAESLLIIPKVLAVNAAKDATELVAKLRAYHHTAQTKADKKHLSRLHPQDSRELYVGKYELQEVLITLRGCNVFFMGLDLTKGTIRNNLEAGVIEPAMSKVKIIQFATEAAITILRIDDMIKLVKDESQNDE